MDVMQLKDISPDQVMIWQWECLHLNATIAFTWAVMALMAAGAWLITRRLSSDVTISRWQNLLEILVDAMRRQIREEGRKLSNMYSDPMEPGDPAD